MAYLPRSEGCGTVLYGLGRKRRRRNGCGAVCVSWSNGSDFGTTYVILSNCVSRSALQTNEWGSNEIDYIVEQKFIQQCEWMEMWRTIIVLHEISFHDHSVDSKWHDEAVRQYAYNYSDWYACIYLDIGWKKRCVTHNGLKIHFHSLCFRQLKYVFVILKCYFN